MCLTSNPKFSVWCKWHNLNDWSPGFLSSYLCLISLTVPILHSIQPDDLLSSEHTSHSPISASGLCFSLCWGYPPRITSALGTPKHSLKIIGKAASSTVFSIQENKTEQKQTRNSAFLFYIPIQLYPNHSWSTDHALPGFGVLCLTSCRTFYPFFLSATTLPQFLSSGCVYVCAGSVMSDSATPCTITCQDPLSMEFPRQEYWSGLPFPPPPIKGKESIISLKKWTNTYIHSGSWKVSIQARENRMATHRTIKCMWLPWGSSFKCRFWFL